MPLAQLLSPAQLAARLNQPDLVLLDCRFALEDPHYGLRSYKAGHIAGAHFADLERELSGPVHKGVSGRHPLPDSSALQAQLQRWGINQDSCVVLYDDGPGAFSARAWWLLTWLGKDNVYLLDGGLNAWQQAGLTLDDEVPVKAIGNFAGKAQPALLVDSNTLKQRLGDPALTLLDARGLPRFRGEVEPIDPVAGHIPGAQCAAFTDNLNSQGQWRNPAELRERFNQLLAGRSAESLVAYCGSGVTACHNLFALCLAGFPLAPLYAGSWSEWINDSSNPIAIGD